MHMKTILTETFEEASQMVGASGTNVAEGLSDADIDTIQQILDESTDDEECFEENVAVPNPKKH